MPTAPIGDTVEVTDWRFVGGQDDELVVEGPVAVPSAWSGPMVASGTVTVFALVDDIPDSASAAVQVMPRSWDTAQVFQPVPELDSADPAFDLPSVPVSLSQLGHTHMLVPALDTAYESGPPWILPITSGPNNLLAYNAIPPVPGVTLYTELNRDAMENPDNPWYQLHPDSGNPEECKEGELSRVLLPWAQAHEQKHVDFAINWFNQPEHSLNALAEAVVLQPDSLGQVYDSTFNLIRNAMNAEKAVNDSVVDGNEGLPPCTPHNLVGYE